MTYFHRHDGTSGWFFVMITEYSQYINSKKLRYYRIETLADHRSWNGSSYLFVEGNEERNIRICEVWDEGGHVLPS